MAQMMTPQVSSRQLQKYLNIARLYVEGFEDFTDPKTKSLNGYAKLNQSHVKALQEIRTLARTRKLADIADKYQLRAIKRKHYSRV